MTDAPTQNESTEAKPEVQTETEAKPEVKAEVKPDPDPLAGVKAAARAERAKRLGLPLEEPTTEESAESEETKEDSEETAEAEAEAKTEDNEKKDEEEDEELSKLDKTSKQYRTIKRLKSEVNKRRQEVEAKEEQVKQSQSEVNTVIKEIRQFVDMKPLDQLKWVAEQKGMGWDKLLQGILLEAADMEPTPTRADDDPLKQELEEIKRQLQEEREEKTRDAQRQQAERYAYGAVDLVKQQKEKFPYVSDYSDEEIARAVWNTYAAGVERGYEATQLEVLQYLEELEVEKVEKAYQRKLLKTPKQEAEEKAAAEEEAKKAAAKSAPAPRALTNKLTSQRSNTGAKVKTMKEREQEALEKVRQLMSK